MTSKDTIILDKSIAIMMGNMANKTSPNEFIQLPNNYPYSGRGFVNKVMRDTDKILDENKEEFDELIDEFRNQYNNTEITDTDWQEAEERNVCIISLKHFENSTEDGSKEFRLYRHRNAGKCLYFFAEDGASSVFPCEEVYLESWAEAHNLIKKLGLSTKQCDIKSEIVVLPNAKF